MKNLDEEMIEKEEVTLISKERVKRLCKSNAHRAPGASGHKSKIMHTKEVLSDGWTRWVCSNCGQVKFSKGITYEEERRR